MASANSSAETLLNQVINFIKTDKALHDVLSTMGICFVILFSISLFLERKPPNASSWFPDRSVSPAKRACEMWFIGYGMVWITVFGITIGTQIYNWFEEIHFMVFCVGLSSPLLLQPILAPSITGDQGKPFFERYAVKANIWIAIFSFIGNYWYTHYFYNVLKASYQFKSWDINGVPIPMFFATHFYFCFYHSLSNLALRKAMTSYKPGAVRVLFTCSLVLTMSYVTAFMEALTISGFHCYAFEDRYMAWVLGSWFYGIYFFVSFPMFFRLDEPAEATSEATKAGKALAAPTHSAFQSAVDSMASGMAVLCLLDFVRVALQVEFRMWLQRPCKLDASQTCSPFTGTFC